MKSKTPDQVERLNNGSFQVTSGNSGKQYIVTIKTKLDSGGSMYFKRECNCPSRRHCHHLDSVQQFQWNEAMTIQDETGDTDYFDVLERTD